MVIQSWTLKPLLGDKHHGNSVRRTRHHRHPGRPPPGATVPALEHQSPGPALLPHHRYGVHGGPREPGHPDPLHRETWVAVRDHQGIDARSHQAGHVLWRNPEGAAQAGRILHAGVHRLSAGRVPTLPAGPQRSQLGDDRRLTTPRASTLPPPPPQASTSRKRSYSVRVPAREFKTLNFVAARTKYIYKNLRFNWGFLLFITKYKTRLRLTSSKKLDNIAKSYSTATDGSKLLPGENIGS